MSTSVRDGDRPSLTLALLPDRETHTPPLFPVDLVAALAAGVHDAGELAALAGGVRPALAA